MSQLNMGLVEKKLFDINQERCKANRHYMWNHVQINEDEITARFERVSGDATCSCGQLIKDHPHSKAVLRIHPDLYLVELCDGKLGKL